MPVAIGQVLQNRYAIQAMLGQGGMGSVYRGYDQALNRYVAIKERHPDSTATADSLNDMRLQFQREAQVLANLNHTNLPRVTDYFSWGGSEYIVMDFVEGKSLDRVAAQYPAGRVPEEIVAKWADEILDALIYLHSRNLIHRDIKPQNIILTPEAHALLVDFGLVKLFDPKNPATMTMLRGMGTPQYAPPEQYGGGMGHTDARSDIYSLGASLFELLTGQPPLDLFHRNTARGGQPSVRSLNSQVSDRMDKLIMKAIEVNPQNRFQAAIEMRQALMALAQKQKAAPKPRPAPAPQPKPRPAPAPQPKPRPAPAPQPTPLPKTAPTTPPKPVTPPQPITPPKPIPPPTQRQAGPPVQAPTMSVGSAPQPASAAQVGTQAIPASVPRVARPSGGTSPAVVFGLAALGVTVVLGLVFGGIWVVSNPPKPTVAPATAVSNSGAPTSAPVVLPTAAPSPTAYPSPAPTSGPRRIVDNFADPSSGWPNNLSGGNYYGSDGQYHISFQAAPFITNYAALPDNYSNFDMQASARLVSATGAYGLLFGYQDESNFYVFAVEPGNGIWAVWKNVAGSTQPIQNWAKSTSISRGQSTNRLMVVTRGTTMTLYANDQSLGSFGGYSVSAGHVGILGYSIDSSPVEVAFDSFQIDPR